MTDDNPALRAGEGGVEALLAGLPWHRAQERDAAALIDAHGAGAMAVVGERLTAAELSRWEHVYWAGVSGIVGSRVRDLPAAEAACRLIEKQRRAWRQTARRSRRAA